MVLSEEEAGGRGVQRVFPRLKTQEEEERLASQRLAVPPPLPRILKEFTKAAIRTQPYDLLRWAAAYFGALAVGLEPPVKERLEFPPLDAPGGLTPGYLKVVHRQQAGRPDVQRRDLERRWQGLCLGADALDAVWALAAPDPHHREAPWLHVVAAASGIISQSPLQTMVLVCETLTSEPEGASACIPMATFEPLYLFVARLHHPELPGIGSALGAEVTTPLLEHLRAVAAEQGGNVTPRNLAHFNCPKLY
ncbi:ropporin-1-like protein isoform X2 [Neocloeon triangulifer]|nr:ropporin-1-like protein isoform X2 [Neocloeon triangulifer]